MLWTENTIWSKCKWATWPYERTATDNVCVHLFPYLWVGDALLELSIPDLAHPRQVQVTLRQGPGLHTAAHCRYCRNCRYYELMRVGGWVQGMVYNDGNSLHSSSRKTLPIIYMFLQKVAAACSASHSLKEVVRFIFLIIPN